MAVRVQLHVWKSVCVCCTATPPLIVIEFDAMFFWARDAARPPPSPNVVPGRSLGSGWDGGGAVGRAQQAQRAAARPETVLAYTATALAWSRLATSRTQRAISGPANTL